MSVVTRNEYGFPMTAYINCLFTGDPAIISMPAPTKLERAQAIAAEVRARKFPAPRRITPSEK